MSRFGFRTRNGLIYPIIQGILPIPIILDVYPTAQIAYSLRLLSSAYTGFAIRVRRSSDNTELNIGFVAGELDTVALTSFVGAGNGFVTIWYDQSGNLQNATQTTAASQPQIVTSGVVETQLGRPALKFNRVSGFGLSTNITILNPFSIIGVMSQDLTTLAATRIFNSTAIGANSIITIRRSDNLSVLTSGATILANFPSQVSNQTYLISFLRQTSTSFIYQNNSIVNNTATSTANWGGFQISTPTFQVDEAFAGKISEVIVYPTNQNSSIDGIHTNINSYYSIY